MSEGVAVCGPLEVSRLNFVFSFLESVYSGASGLFNAWRTFRGRTPECKPIRWLSTAETAVDR